MSYIIIGLGESSNRPIGLGKGTKVKFLNTTDETIVLTTPLGINPGKDTTIKKNKIKRKNGFKITGNTGSSQKYTWDDKKSSELATRSGTIRVT